MASGLKVESSNSPNIGLEEKCGKTVTFSEPRKSTEGDKQGRRKVHVRPKGENRNPKRTQCRHDSLSKYNDASYQKPGKRRYSFGSANDLKSGQKRRRQSAVEEKIILPTKFLLGGNINDPLNLGSLQDEEVNRRLNAVTPQSSPLPTPKHHLQVEVLIPPNIRDPLNLNNDDQDLELCLLSPNKVGRKKKHKRSRSKSGNEESPVKAAKLSEDVSVANVKEEVKTVLDFVTKQSEGKPDKPSLNIKKKNEEKKIDKIVSPVVPQGPTLKNRKKASAFTRSISREGVSSDKIEIAKSRRKAGKRRHSSGTSNASVGNVSNHVHFRPKDEVFQHGNYNRYYGYRNHKLDSDPRLKCLKREWIEGKDVLDIGCNVGHLTLTISKEFSPQKIIGIDIDGKLIQAAERNVRHYMTSQLTKPDSSEDFPISLAICYGPIVASAIPHTSHLFSRCQSLQYKFPYNISFLQGDYVLESDELLDTQKPEFDLILALSLTKWVHLNNGDAGLKRLFKRIFNQLRPGGKFVLEAQAWPSYDKKKKLTEKIYQNYLSIQLKPEHFTEYLLSKQVGFTTCEVIDTPQNPSRGFRRPIQLFTKAAASPRDIPDETGP